MLKKSAPGFTLIELLVVIAIISILAVVGITIFTSVQRNARDAKRKGDIDSIAKAFEIKYQTSGKYVALVGSDFTQGSIPRDPDGANDYYQGLASDGSSFKVCAALDANSTRVCTTESATCICKNSAQSTISGGATLNQIAGGGGASCDTTGTLASGLIGYWKLDETTSGANAVDSTAGAHTGIATGTTVANPGKLGRGRNFAGGVGGNESIRIPNPGTITGPFTLSAWINPIDIGASAGRIVSKDTNADGGYRFELEMLPGPLVALRINTAGAGTVTVINTTATLNAWSQVTGTFDGTNMKLYVNGTVVAGPTAFTGQIATNNFDAYIGNELTGNRGFNGTIDDVRIYNRALNSTEVTNLYNSNNGCALP